jgi:hypothetical protein
MCRICNNKGFFIARWEAEEAPIICNCQKERKKGMMYWLMEKLARLVEKITS